MEREDVLENKNQSCFRWSQGSFATTLASMRPTSWTSWGRNMLAMEFGNYFNFTRGRGRVRHLIGGTRHILGVYWLWEEHLFWIQTTGTEWILWTRTLQTTMQHVSGEFLKLIFLLSSLIPINNYVSCREPAIVKANAITAASEATCLLLSVDETVKNPRSASSQVIQSQHLWLTLPKVKFWHNFSQVWPGCRSDGRRHARRDGQRQGKTNVKPTKTDPALISACLVS